MPDPIRLTQQRFLKFLGELSETAFREFVADLWTEAGWDTRIEDGVVIARSETNGETRHIGVYADTRSLFPPRLRPRVEDLDSSAVDVVVVGWEYQTESTDRLEGRTTDVRDGADLYHKLLYALDRSTARTLCRRYFDRQVKFAPEPPPSGRNESLDWDRILPDRRRVSGAGLLLVLVALVTSAVLGGGGVPILHPGATPVAAAAGPPDVRVLSTASAPNAVVQAEYTGERMERWPLCARSPKRGIELFLSAMRAATPSKPSTFRRAWEFADPATRSSYEAFVDNATAPRFRPLHDFEAVEMVGSWEDHQLGPRESSQRRKVRLVASGGNTTYWFQVSKRNTSSRRIDSRQAAAAPFKSFKYMSAIASKNAGCWFVSSVSNRSKSRQTATPEGSPVLP